MDNCVSPYGTFSETKDWLLHMESEHKRKIVRWTCNAKQHTSPQIFGSREELVAHLQHKHGTGISEKQRAIISKRSGGPAPEMFTRCPLCDWSPHLGNEDGSVDEDLTHREAKEAKEIRLRDCLHKHIADHLQMIALRSLPDESIGYLDQPIRSSSSSSSSSTTTRSEIGASITLSEIDFLQSLGEGKEERALTEERFPVDHSEEWSPISQLVTPISRDRDWGQIYYGLARKGLVKPCEYPCQA
jgi:hypothetical protein